MKRTAQGKRYLYYELTCRHPVAGGPSIPITCLITTDQSLPLIQYWIDSFRQAEAQTFGHGNIAKPVQINSDRSMVFLLAAMRTFNQNNYKQYVDQCFRIVSGTATKSDIQLTVVHVHACATHFMRDCKNPLFQIVQTTIQVWHVLLQYFDELHPTVRSTGSIVSYCSCFKQQVYLKAGQHIINIFYQ